MAARNLPSSLRVFLLTLAIVDDLGAIALIAVLFSSGVVWQPLVWVVGMLLAGGVLARFRKIPAPFWDKLYAELCMVLAHARELSRGSAQRVH